MKLHDWAAIVCSILPIILINISSHLPILLPFHSQSSYSPSHPISPPPPPPPPIPAMLSIGIRRLITIAGPFALISLLFYVINHNPDHLVSEGGGHTVGESGEMRWDVDMLSIYLYLLLLYSSSSFLIIQNSLHHSSSNHPHQSTYIKLDPLNPIETTYVKGVAGFCELGGGFFISSSTIHNKHSLEDTEH